MIFKTDWKKAYIWFALFFIAIDFLMLGSRFPSNFFHVDHSFHITKFVEVMREGIGVYPEQGNLPVRIFFVPVLIPFVLLAKIIPPRLAYFSTYFLMMAITYLVAKKITPGNEKYVLLPMLFPLSALSFLRLGRLLEFASHLAFILLLYYLDKGKDPRVSTALFMVGTTSHLPTMVFYGPLLFFKAIEKGLIKDLIYWGTTLFAWLAIYLPPTLGKTGWVYPRAQILYKQALGVLFSQGWTWLIFVLTILIIFILIATFFMGREGIYSMPSVAISVIFPLFVLFDIPFTKYIPGWNQIIITTLMPLFSYLLIRKDQRLWKLVTLVTIGALVFPFPWTSPLSENTKYLDQIEGNYTISKFPDTQAYDMVFAGNYLAYRGIPTPKSPTFEYSDPQWFFYEPENCEDLRVGIKYIILPKQETWATACGNVTETPHYQIVKLL